MSKNKENKIEAAPITSIEDAYPEQPTSTTVLEETPETIKVSCTKNQRVDVLLPSGDSFSVYPGTLTPVDKGLKGFIESTYPALLRIV